MFPSFNRRARLIFGLIAIVELISFLAYFVPSLNAPAAILIFLAVLWLSRRSLSDGLALAMIELVIGSKGHLLAVGGVSVRILIFAAIMLVYLSLYLKADSRAKALAVFKDKNYRPYWYLAIFVVIGLVMALINHNGFVNIYSDINAWLFFILILPAAYVGATITPQETENLQAALTASLLWLATETLLILYIFSHNLVIVPDFYLWLRHTGVAEITMMAGNWPRIFLQSQIFSGWALIFAAGVVLAAQSWQAVKKNWSLWLLSVGSISALILSMSRSFWVAFVLAFAALLVYLALKKNWQKLGRLAAFVGISLVLAAVLMIVIIKFPYPASDTSFSTEALTDRTSLDDNEAAVASRWSLLPALVKKIASDPWLGSGYGAPVTYISKDPRVLANNPSGSYTTYAFEWGYLGLWLKLGLFGLITYLYYLWFFFKKGFNLRENNNFWFWTSAVGILFLVLVNIFTPYLDYPLGIGYLIAVSVLLNKQK
jgi:O-antigen ligase